MPKFKPIAALVSELWTIKNENSENAWNWPFCQILSRHPTWENLAYGIKVQFTQCVFSTSGQNLWKLTLICHIHVNINLSYPCLQWVKTVCVSTVYKLLTRFILQIEHISRLYTNLPRFPTYRFLSNAFFHVLQHFSLIIYARSAIMYLPESSIYYAYT